MIPTALRKLPLVFALLVCLTGSGCKAQPSSNQVQSPVSSSDIAATSARLHDIAAAGKLVELHGPDFSDYQSDFQRVYQASNYTPIWVVNGQPTPQALGVIAVLEASAQKGLKPEDYDASRWQGRIAALKNSANADMEAN